MFMARLSAGISVMGFIRTKNRAYPELSYENSPSGGSLKS